MPGYQHQAGHKRKRKQNTIRHPHSTMSVYLFSLLLLYLAISVECCILGSALKGHLLASVVLSAPFASESEENKG